MGKYTQLTQEQGYQIYAFKKAGFSQAAIAHETGIHKSTVSREIRRNRGKRGYRPKQAHAMAVGRRSKAKKFVKMTPQVVVLIEDLIGQDFSPEKKQGSRLHSSLYVKNEDLTPMSFQKSALSSLKKYK